MKIPGYDIELELAVKKINRKNYQKVFLQVPEGLKNYISKFVDFIENHTSSNVIVYGDPCFGACDIINDTYKEIGVDYCIHIGHLPIPNLNDKSSIPIDFINAHSNLDVTCVVEKAIPSIIGKKVGIVTTAQHIHMVKKISEILKKNNFEPVIGQGDNRIYKKGQILGCNFSSADYIAGKVDCFLYIGSGNFHPIGLLLKTSKPLIACDPYTNQVNIKELDEIKDMILRQRYGAIARSKDAKLFGILISTKLGQMRIVKALTLKEKIKNKDKKSIIISLNHFLPNFIESFRDIDCFISTACPRIAIDDYMQYKTPIITPLELDIVLGFRKWKDYNFDEITQ